MNTHQDQRWTTPTALAAYLGVAAETMRQWLRGGYVVGRHVGHRHYTDDRPRKTSMRRWRIYEADVTAFLEHLRAGTKPPASLWRR